MKQFALKRIGLRRLRGLAITIKVRPAPPGIGGFLRMIMMASMWSPLSRSMVHTIKLILQILPYAAFGFTQRDVLLCRGLVISVLEQSLSDASAFAPRRACDGEGEGKWSSRILPLTIWRKRW